MGEAVSEALTRLKAMKPEEAARAYKALADRVSQAERDRVKSKRCFLTDAELDDKLTLIYAERMIADFFVGVTLGTN